MPRTITIEIKADTKQFSTAMDGVKRKVSSALDAAPVNAFRSAVGGLTGVLGALAGVAAFKQIAQFGIDLDKSRNAMTALTGSVEAANKKLTELRELAKASPGVTATFATQLFNQLKAIGGIGDEVINKVIKSLGRLNAVFGDVGPEFARNLIQIFTQGFERADIKEALGRVPIFEQLLERAFGTKDPEKLRKLKESGKLTLGGFLTGFSEGIVSDPRFKNIQDGLGSRLAKSFDETKLKLAELGERILRDLIPILDKLLPAINSILDVFTKMPVSLQAMSLAFIALPGPITGAVSAVKGLTTAFLGLGAAMQASLGIVGLALVGGGVAVQGFRDLLARSDANLQIQLNKSNPRDLSGNSLFTQIPKPAQGESLDAFRARVGAGSGTVFDPVTGTFGGAQAKNEFEKALKDLEKTSGGKARRDRFVNDFGLNETALLEHEAELARIRQSNEAVAERRQRVLEQAQRPAQLAGFNAALQERIRLLELETLRLEENTRAQSAAELQRGARRDLQRSGRSIDAAVNRGQLTAGEAESLSQGANREFANQLREVLAIKEKLLNVNDPLLDDLRDEIALYDQLGTSISSTERFLRGFNSATETVGDAFERLGQNVSRALTNTKDLLNSLKQAVLGFFNDLLGQSLQNLFRSIFAPIAGALGGTGGAGGGSGIGGILGNIFRTPSTFPTQIAQAFAGSGSGLSAPPSVSGGGGILSSLGSFFSGGGGLGAPAGLSRIGDPFAATQFGLSTSNLGGRSFLGGIGQSFAAAAPLLGLGLGGSLGGQSIGGQILGGAGGLLAGGAVAGFSGALGATATAFFTNPFTIAIGAGLLIGSFFLGKAKQRRQDEEAAGQFLGQAFQAVEQLAAGIASDQIDGGSARSILESQIVGPFIQQINSLKTASVRRDWVKNQVPEIRGRFEANVVPLIAAQEERRRLGQRSAAIDSRLIPQFASGGLVGGIDRGFDSVRALLRPGEMVLTQAQQGAIALRGGSDIFRSAGVPGVQPQATFQTGGIAPSVGRGEPMVIQLDVQLGMTEGDTQALVARGINTRTGEDIVVNIVQRARGRGRQV